MAIEKGSIRVDRRSAIKNLLRCLSPLGPLDSNGHYVDPYGIIYQLLKEELERIIFEPVNGQRYKYKGSTFVLVHGGNEKWGMCHLCKHTNDNLTAPMFQSDVHRKMFFTKGTLVEQFHADEWELVPGKLGILRDSPFKNFPEDDADIPDDISMCACNIVGKSECPVHGNQEEPIIEKSPISKLDEIVKAHRRSMDVPEGHFKIHTSLTFLRDLHKTIAEMEVANDNQ